MSETVSEPNHHSDAVPTKAERDAAYSLSGGRKAIEKSRDELDKEDSRSEKKSLSAPIGLDAETKAQADTKAETQSCDDDKACADK